MFGIRGGHHIFSMLGPICQQRIVAIKKYCMRITQYMHMYCGFQNKYICSCMCYCGVSLSLSDDYSVHLHHFG